MGTPATADGHASGGQRYRPICIVDDDAGVRDSLSVLLEALGFQVFTHASGSEFLADKRRRCTGCLIIDYHLSGIDGLDTLGALQSQGIFVPTILITGRLDPTVATRASRLGVAAVLEKPFATASLVRLIGDRLRGSQ
jgi:FixJ family two-component response regulator